MTLSLYKLQVSLAGENDIMESNSLAQRGNFSQCEEEIRNQSCWNRVDGQKSIVLESGRWKHSCLSPAPCTFFSCLDLMCFLQETSPVINWRSWSIWIKKEANSILTGCCTLDPEWLARLVTRKWWIIGWTGSVRARPAPYSELSLREFLVYHQAHGT